MLAMAVVVVVVVRLVAGGGGVGHAAGAGQPGRLLHHALVHLHAEF